MKKAYYLTLLTLFPILKMLAQPIGWSNTAPYQITENSGNLVTNYQAKLTVNTQALVMAGQMQASGDDIRFGKDCAGNTLYNYWIESGMNTASTVIWVKIDTLYPSSTRTFYMYYGNSSATSVTAIPGVFAGPMSSTDSLTYANPGGVTDSQRGFRFEPTEDILITAFGKNEPNGSTRYITLFNFATQAILSQQQVSGPAAQYSYQNIPSPVWLTQGTQYLLEMHQGATDGYYFGGPTQMGQHLIYYDMRYCNGCTENTFPTNIVGGMHYGYPDMWYWIKNNVSPAPTVAAGTALSYAAGPDPTICAGDSILVGAPATGGNGPYAYSWTPTTGISSPASGATYANPATTSVYTITVTDNTGCTTTDFLTINVNPLPTISASHNNDTICPGLSTLVSASGSAISFDWQPGGNTNASWMASPVVNTTYTVTGTASNGCTNTATTTIAVIPNPTVGITGNYAFICDNAVAQLDLTASGAQTYDWNSGAGSGTLFSDTPSASQTYTVIGVDHYGCSDTATYDVTFYQHPVAAVSSTADTICAGACITLSGTANGGSSPYIFLWPSQSVTALSIIDCPVTSTCYDFLVIDNNGCSDTILHCVTVNPLPNMTVTGNSPICNGNPSTLSASGATTYVWADVSTLDTAGGNPVLAAPTSTTTYTVTGTDSLGCVDSTTFTLVVNPSPNVTYTSSLNTVCLNDGAAALSGGSPAGGTYSGAGVSAGVFTPMTAGNGSHLITYTYTDANGCSSFATHTVVVNPCTGINEAVAAGGISVYPNPFSTIVTIERANSSDVTLTIFDAEGRLVMSKKANGTKIEIETSELANGIYSLQVIDESGVKTFRVAKNN